MPVEEVASTAHAAMKAARTVPLAAISSAMAKEVYDLKSVAANIEDQSNNITRFLVIGKMSTKPSGDDKTSLVFSVQDKPGVLHRMLQPFARSRINLTQDRIAADQKQAVGISVFSRSARPSRTDAR